MFVAFQTLGKITNKKKVLTKKQNVTFTLNLEHKDQTFETIEI